MNVLSFARPLLLLLSLAMFAGCADNSSPIPIPSSTTTAPLSANNLNLVFVVSPDLAYPALDHPAHGDINRTTANITNQGLQRSLLMATFLKQQVLGSKNVTGIYALEPMTHLQTANNYPDMAALTNIQQFSLLNQITIQGVPGYSYPVNTSYAAGDIPAGIATPSPLCPNCQGLVFKDNKLSNLALVNAIIKANAPGFHVFSAPWETISELLKNINNLKGYNLPLPAGYASPNIVYAITITPSGSGSLVTYNSNLNPSPSYPVLPAPLPLLAACGAAPFNIPVTGGINGATIPADINKNETVYIVRHAEAHPTNSWEDGNYIGAGQWRALGLPYTLRGKISPNLVYSIDPSQVIQGSGNNYSYVRPSLTVAPYAIANNLPYNLISTIELADLDSPRLTSDFFFKHGTFNNQTVLLAWEHDHIPFIVEELFKSYFPIGSSQVPARLPWQGSDYDSIWRVKLDAQGNLTVDNALCEGIDSAVLLGIGTAPQF
jgi:hypothetical protein